MARLEQLPGMESDRRVRNLAVGTGYLVAVPIAIALLPLLALGAVATDYRGAATRLSTLPGIDRGGGLKAGAVAGVYVVLCWGLLAGITYGGFAGSGAGPGVSDAESDSDPSGPDGGDSEGLSSDEDGELTEGEIVLLFETVVEREDIQIASAERDGDVFDVEFYRTATTESELLENVGYIMGVYVGAVGEGLETERMELTALDETDDSPEFSWHVDSEWAQRYHDGELTMDDVIERSLVTADGIDPADAEDATETDDGSDAGDEIGDDEPEATTEIDDDGGTADGSEESDTAEGTDGDESDDGADGGESDDGAGDDESDDGAGDDESADDEPNGENNG